METKYQNKLSFILLITILFSTQILNKQILTNSDINHTYKHKIHNLKQPILNPQSISAKDQSGDISDYISAFSTLFITGIFDRSSLVTALMAMKYSKSLVIISSGICQSVLGIIAVLMGFFINNYISKLYLDLCAVVLFLFFGIKMLYEGHHMPEGNSEHAITENKTGDKEEEAYTETFFKVFMIIFFSEIGDSSQITTIYLTVNFNKVVVAVAMLVCVNLLTVIAVYSGALIAKLISEKKLTLIAGGLFVVLALAAFILTLVDDVFVSKHVIVKSLHHGIHK